MAISGVHVCHQRNSTKAKMAGVSSCLTGGSRSGAEPGTPAWPPHDRSGRSEKARQGEGEHAMLLPEAGGPRSTRPHAGGPPVAPVSLGSGGCKSGQRCWLPRLLTLCLSHRQPSPGVLVVGRGLWSHPYQQGHQSHFWKSRTVMTSRGFALSKTGAAPTLRPCWLCG